MTEYKELNLEDITLTEDNPRKRFDENKLRQLGNSLLMDGQLHRIWVRSKGDKYELVEGERRYRAAKLVGMLTLKAKIEDVDDARAMEIRLIENTQREDLTEAEKGNAISHLLTEYPEKYPTIKALAQKLQKAEDTINGWLRKSERLSEYVKKSVAGNRLSDRTAALLLKFDHITQNKLAQAIINYEIPRQKGGLEPRREFVRRYELSPEKYPTVESLGVLANEVKGVKKVKIDLAKLSPEARVEVEKTIEEAKEEAKKLRAKRVKKPRRKIRRQGRPPKKKPTAEEPSEGEKQPLPPLTMPEEVKTVTVAFNFPVPLWEKITRYQAQKQMLLEEAIISLLETHPLLQEI